MDGKVQQPQQGTTANLPEEVETKVLVLPADIVLPPELCDFLAQVIARIAREKINAAQNADVEKTC
ncbi:MAG: hypothetical protein H0U76_10580 [Ktedonobacteraceae bacterium]|nr:hypothetical protein [Ktedonobacteraceae bacterium]